MLTQERLEAFDEASTAELARRLEEDDYPSPFDSLSDWHLLRALAIHQPRADPSRTTTWWTRNLLMRIEQASPLRGRRVLVAVSGSIAAVKTPLLVSALVKAGAAGSLSCHPQRCSFGEPCCSCQPQPSSLLSGCGSVEPHRLPRPLHIELAEWAEVTIVAPLSASSLARWSLGSADGLLASVLLATEAPVIAAPAMNTAMWRHPAVQRQLVADSRLPWGDPFACRCPVCWPVTALAMGEWPTRLLIQLAAANLSSAEALVTVDASNDWLGKSVLVSAGPTQESH